MGNLLPAESWQSKTHTIRRPCHLLPHPDQAAVPRDAVRSKAVRCDTVQIGPRDAAAPDAVVPLVAAP